MFVASYRNTVAGAKKIAAQRQSEQGKQGGAIVSEARKEASHILASAMEMADGIVNKAEEEARLILIAAREEATKILSRAGLDASDTVGRVPVLDIIKAVAAKHGLTVAQIKGHGRQKALTAARHEAISRVYAARPDLSLPQIGRIFHRDHTTILHAVRKTAVYRGDHDNEGET